MLAAVLTVGLAACGGNGTSSGDSSGSASSDTGSHRPDYVAEETDTGFVDTDGQFDYTAVDWAGPKGYVIVVPAGNTEAKKSAVDLQDFFKTAANVTLQIVTDSTKETDKEILVGKTKRSQSNTSLAEGELEVSVKGAKLVFDGGHDVTVDSAVHKFTRLAYEEGKAKVFKVKTDFSSTCFLDGYEYVWGDEFEAEEVDLTKWGFYAHMSGTPTCKISYDREIIDTADGRLKLHGIRYFDPADQNVQYKMPYSTVTKYNMNFIYGYCEIRARMPFFRGAWPSFWTQSTDQVSSKYGVTRTKKYFVEIDVFEVFGSEKGEVVSNIHKWYDPGQYDYANLHNAEGVTHTMWNKEKMIWTCKDVNTINQEYHTYGWEWNPYVMSFYVDQELIMTYDIVNSYDLSPDMTGFHDPEFVMFNSHLTAQDASFGVGRIEDNTDKLPSEYYIDYFRLYQKKDGKSKLFIDETVSGEYKDRV